MGLQRVSGFKIGGGSFDSVTVEKTITVHGDADFDEGTLFVDDSTNRVGVGTTAPGAALSVINDYEATTFENLMANGIGGGEVLKFGGGSTVLSQLYYLHTDGGWELCDSDAIASGGTQLIGIALGTDPGDDGLLLRGFVRIAAAKIQGTPNEGLPCYVSENPTSCVDFTRPSGSGDFVRMVGYCIDIDGGDALIYFNPSADVIELA